MTPSDDGRARFERLYREHHADLLSYLVRRVDDRQDAADLLADTFLVAWRRIDDVPLGDSARLWLFGVARNVLANSRRRDETAHRLAESLRTHLATVASGTTDTSEYVVVRAALSRLAPKDREVMMLAAYEELTPAEIAAVLGRSAASVRVRLHRARRRLAKELGPHDGGQPSVSPSVMSGRVLLARVDPGIRQGLTPLISVNADGVGSD